MQQFDGQVRIIGVASRDQEPAMADFVSRHGLEDMTNIADLDGEIWQLYGVVAQPAWVFIDGDTGQGTRVLGALPPDDLADRLDGLSG